MNNTQPNYKATLNDLVLTVTLNLNINEGDELISAIGYPQACSNKSAIKHWVTDHYECYQCLDRQEIIQQIINDITEQVSSHFGFNIFSVH